ncbi:MAG TPA: UDP-N-acetylmuramate--L-alanine ligase [Acidimicrobiales bacterium]|jgi:UDP-N-acetylmuramate--alanine ligase|nr:UDP-N-acetylmuramate--L-alanine ligase [Acidimicrobiales bacterium]
MPAEPIELSTAKRIHIVGVGGAGMSGLARVLVGLGHTVSGSDLVPSQVSASLGGAGVVVAIGHEAANVGDVELVTHSPAVRADNVELDVAASRGIRVATRAEVLGALSTLRETIAIAGTHGKTTTSSMLALVLSGAGRSPSWLVGADVAGLGANARLDDGPELVMEADESYGSFAYLRPALVAVTNVEADHLDYYGSIDALRLAFRELMERSSVRLVNADDPIASELGRELGAHRVGSSHDDDFVVSDVSLGRAAATFRLRHSGGTLDVCVGAPGRHNVSNASVAAAVAILRGVSDDDVVESLGRFAGVPRRFEFRGEFNGASVVDDYAHLPSEVEAAIATARAGGWGRIVAVFQPHRYTRTEALAASFADAFNGADLVVVTDVYAAGEAPIPGVTGRLVADAVASSNNAPPVRYVKERAVVAEAVSGLVGPGDLLLTMGAGDLTSLADELRDAGR